MANRIAAPTSGTRIGYENNQIVVPDDPILPYIEGALALKGKDRTETLVYFFRFLAHEDSSIAEDAFLEFARSTDAEVAQAARDGLRFISRRTTPDDQAVQLSPPQRAAEADGWKKWYLAVRPGAAFEE